MKKEFTSRFMPDVKFSIMGDKRHLLKNIGLTFLANYVRTASDGSIVGLCDSQSNYESWNCATEVSIFEAIPELIPDGMKYNKELDRLVPVSNLEIEYLYKELINENKTNLDLIIQMTKELSPKYPFGQEVIFSIIRDNLLFKGVHKLKENSENELMNKLKQENSENEKTNFIKFNEDKIDFSLVDAFAYEDLGKCLTFGAKKYSKNNWIQGDLDTYISALERHLMDIKKAAQTGNNQYFIDNDSELQHGANLLCNAMFIHYFIRKQIEEGRKNDN